MKKKNRIGTVFIYLIFIVLCLAILYPFLCVLSVSLSSAEDIKLYGFRVLPKHLDFSAYSYLFRDSKMLWQAYGTTIFVSVVGTAIGCLVTSLYAYAISRTTFRWRGVLSLFVTFTMFFSGGMVPTYLLISRLHLLDTIWAILLPSAVGMYNIIIMRTYFQTTIPQELEDAAEVDGCTNFRFLLSVALPLSRPVIVVIALYYGVGRWNDYFAAMMYLTKRAMYPLQLVLREILLQNQAGDMLHVATDAGYADRMIARMGLKYAVIVISTLPILVIFPFVQRFFAKGVMIGAIKG